MPRFPAAFRPPAFASRAILFPPGSSAFLTVGLPDAIDAGPGRGFHVPHARDPAGVGALCTPGTAVFTRPAKTPGRRLPLPNGQPCTPAGTASHPPGAHLDEASSRVHSRSPVRPSPRLWPPDGTRTLRLLPRASHPAVTRDARQGGDGPSSTGPGYVIDITADLQSTCHSHMRPRVARARSCRRPRALAAARAGRGRTVVGQTCRSRHRTRRRRRLARPADRGLTRAPPAVPSVSATVRAGRRPIRRSRRMSAPPPRPRTPPGEQHDQPMANPARASADRPPAPAPRTSSGASATGSGSSNPPS